MDNTNLLRVGIASDPTTLDPIYSVDLTSQKINSLLFSKLFRFDREGNVEGELAKEFSFKGNLLRINLEKVQTKNDVSLTTKDVAYSLNRLKTEK